MCYRCVAVGIFAPIVFAGTARAGATLPLVAGNFSLAQKFLHGDAHAIMLGDSIQGGLVGLYPSTWQIDKWSGIVAGDNLASSVTGDTGVFAFGFAGAPYIASQSTELIDTTNPLVAGQIPGASHVINFEAQQVSSGGNLLSNRVVEYNLKPNQQNIYHGGSWDDLGAGTMHADAILLANPSGIPSGLQFLARGADLNTPLASAMVDAQSAADGLIEVPLSFPSQTSFRSSGIAGSLRFADGVTPPTNSNVILAGIRYYNGQAGFQLANIGWGGKDVDYFIQGADQHLDQFIQMTDTNMAYIWVGQNDVSKYTGPQFKSRMQLLISKYKAIRPNMTFVLVSSYDTGSSTLADYAQGLYEISQTDPSVLFLNLYESAGSFSFLDSNYLKDHVHPNDAGDVYFANLTQSLLAMADAQAPRLAGDANLDGVVDSKDFVAMASNFGSQNAYLAVGDFNGDRVTNALDFNVLATNFGQTLPDATTIAPEPAAASLIALLALVRRRKRS